MMPNRERDLRRAEWERYVGRRVLEARPEWATGFYLTWGPTAIRWGKRTNREKAPANYVFLED